MAPKNRPQRGSFNTRGRQKVAAQQAGRRAATPPTTNALPPRGGSGAGRPKAVAQRTAAAVGQRAQQDVKQLRGLARYLQYQSNQADKQIPPRTSPVVTPPNTLARSPRGAMAAPPSAGSGRPALPPGSRGGSPARSSGGKVDPPIERVRVRDLGSKSNAQIPAATVDRVRVRDLGSSRPSLPATKPFFGWGSTDGGYPKDSTRPRGPSSEVDAANNSRSGRPSGSGGRPALPAGKSGGALATTAKGVGRLGRFLRGAGSVAGAGMAAFAAGAEAQKILNPKDNIIHDLSNLGIAIENKVNGKDGRRPYSGESAGAVGGNRRRGLSGEKAGPPVPKGLPNRNKPTPPSAPSRPSASSGSPASRPSAASSPRSTGNSPRSASSSPRSAPASTPTSAPKATPTAAKPAAKAPEEPNLYNVPRTGVAKFRTDMNPLGKKIVGTTNFSKSVPSERAFDTNSDYSSSLSIPDKKKRKS